MLTDKFVKKYLRMAKLVAEDQNPCYARHVGAIIVDPVANKIVGAGYNGPPKSVAHCDEPKHLRHVVWPQLTESEKNNLSLLDNNCDEFVSAYSYCQKCPRKLLGAQAGKRLELCSCVHAEANAIINAAQNIKGCFIFCWCPLPCIECSKLIINSGIQRVYCYKQEDDYSVGSRFILTEAGVEIYEFDQNFIDLD